MPSHWRAFRFALVRSCVRQSVHSKMLCQQSRNFTGMFYEHVISCASGVSLLDLFNICRLFALDLVKKSAILNLCCTQLNLCHVQLKQYLTKKHATLQECWSACVAVHIEFCLICKVGYFHLVIKIDCIVSFTASLDLHQGCKR